MLYWLLWCVGGWLAGWLACRPRFISIFVCVIIKIFVQKEGNRPDCCLTLVDLLLGPLSLGRRRRLLLLLLLLSHQVGVPAREFKAEIRSIRVHVETFQKLTSACAAPKRGRRRFSFPCPDRQPSWRSWRGPDHAGCHLRGSPQGSK